MIFNQSTSNNQSTSQNIFYCGVQLMIHQEELVRKRRLCQPYIDIHCFTEYTEALKILSLTFHAIFSCPRIYNACRLCKIRGNQLNKINQLISDKIYECTTLKVRALMAKNSSIKPLQLPSHIQIISSPQCKAFICDGCKAKIDEHYQFKMQCIRNVNLQRFNNAIGTGAVAPSNGIESSEPPATGTMELMEAVPSSSKVD